MAAQHYSRHLKEKHSDVWKSSKGDLREWGDQPLNFLNPRPAASAREVAKPGEEHGEVSDFDLDISRSGSDRSMSPPEAEEFNVDRLLRFWSFLILKLRMRTEK